MLSQYASCMGNEMHGGVAISKEDVMNEKQMASDERRKQLKDEQAYANEVRF